MKEPKVETPTLPGGKRCVVAGCTRTVSHPLISGHLCSPCYAALTGITVDELHGFERYRQAMKVLMALAKATDDVKHWPR